MARRKRDGLKTNRTIRSRTLILMGVCGILAFVVLAGRLFMVQILAHDKYEEMAVEQQTKETNVSAPRGTIYDRNGKVLAMSADVETVYISPAELVEYKEDANAIADNLSRILGVDKVSILEKFQDTDSWYKTIRRKIEGDLADELRQYISDNSLKSVHLEADTKRYYPYGSLACHVIGFVGDDNYGLEGLEAEYNSDLAGVSGRVVRLKSQNGVDMLFNDFEDYYDAQDGGDVTLTIDVTMQHYVEKYLQQAIEDYDVLNGGACILMNPKTGEIYAMASMGNFDLNDYLTLSPKVQEKINKIEDPAEKEQAESDALFRQWRNKAIADTYEPGSVFKIITMSMALDSGSISEEDSFDCQGAITGIIGRDDPLHCWNPAGHGPQNPRECLINSCNVAFVQIAMRIGAPTFYQYVDAFGFFDKTGIDLGGEGESLWWSEDVFFDEDNQSQLAAASFGQTFNITPIQLATAVSSVVNGGYLMKPYVVEKITDSDGKIVKANEPTQVRQVISKETSAIMCDYLESVVSDTAGTSKTAYVAGYRVGGKTGTSEKVTLLAESGHVENIASFCGVAPCDDPQVVCLLLLDTPNPAKGLYISGSSMAAPTVGQILAEVLPYLEVEPVYTEEEKEYVDVSVPNLKRMTIEEAEKALEDQRLSVRVVGDGNTVSDQLPSAGQKVAAGSQVVLYAGEKIPTEMVTVPDLHGESYYWARIILDNYGLYIYSTGAPSISDDAFVQIQTIEPGKQVKYGSVIGVTLVDSSTLGNF